MKWQIAIDGPSGAGKSTIAAILANKLGMEYLDTGAMYRAVTLKALRLGIDLFDEKCYDFLENTTIGFVDHNIMLDGVDVSKEIRSVEVTNNVSVACKYKYVRDRMVELQREIGEEISIIMDGRDIGTVVLPNADVKIYLTASIEVRARRRMKEREEKGISNQSLEEIMSEIEARDFKDSNREISPLRKASDAIEIDTTELSVSDVVQRIISIVNERGYKMEDNKNVEMNVAEEVKEEVTEAVEAASEEVAVKEDAVAAEAVVEENKEDEAVSPASEDASEVKTVKELQLVKVTVVEVLPAEDAITRKGEVVRKAKEERVLVSLENGQEGLLFRKDLTNVDPDSPLVDQFLDGDTFEAVVKKVFPDGGKVLLSQTLLEKRNALKQFEEVIANHGSIVAKVVKKIEVGLVLDYQGYACLLPTSQISDKNADAKSLIGKEIEVSPIRIDYNRIRLIVSQAVADAIRNKAEKTEFISSIVVGQVFEGTVKNVESYGVFVELGHNVEGLLHISEIDHNRVAKIEKVLKTGDTVKVQVIKVDSNHISLSRKALLPNHWKNYVDTVKTGDDVKGVVAEINKAGVVIDLATEVQGFLPKSEVSWEKDAVIEDLTSVGSEIEAKIIELDSNKKRIILSLKQLHENPWTVLTFKPGEEVKCTVVKKLADGYKIAVNGASGYLPNGNVPNDVTVTEGQELTAKVRAFEPERTRLIVSLRPEREKTAPSREKNSVDKYLQGQEKVTSTFGDFLNLDDYKNLKK